jgi:hypothetical protein
LDTRVRVRACSAATSASNLRRGPWRPSWKCAVLVSRGDRRDDMTRRKLAKRWSTRPAATPPCGTQRD